MPAYAASHQLALPSTTPGAGRSRSLADWRSPLGRPLVADDVLTAAEVAALLHVPKSTVEDWARRDVIPSRKVGRRRLYLRPSIEHLLLAERPKGDRKSA